MLSAIINVYYRLLTGHNNLALLISGVTDKSIHTGKLEASLTCSVSLKPVSFISAMCLQKFESAELYSLYLSLKHWLSFSFIGRSKSPISGQKTMRMFLWSAQELTEYIKSFKTSMNMRCWPKQNLIYYKTYTYHVLHIWQLLKPCCFFRYKSIHNR